MATLLAIIILWGKTNFEKTSPNEFFDVLFCFEREKVDLTAESQFLKMYSLFAGSTIFFFFLFVYMVQCREDIGVRQ